MTLTNYQIYSLAQALNTITIDKNLYLPVKVSFYLYKNIDSLMNAAAEIEEARMQILQHYMSDTEEVEISEQGKFEIADLFNLEQEINIHMLKLEYFDNIQLTMEQMNAIMFMIEE